jgi:uncharacterized protein (DUF1778 family)
MSKVFDPAPDAMITMRLPAAEKDKLVEAARVECRNLTSFLRLHAVRAAEKVLATEQRPAA